MAQRDRKSRFSDVFNESPPHEAKKEFYVACQALALGCRHRYDLHVRLLPNKYTGKAKLALSADSDR